MSGITTGIEDDYDVVEHTEAALSDDEISELQKRLRSTDYLAVSGEYRRHLTSQAPETGLWICDTSQYLEWRASRSHASLWIKGVPGAGKSVIAASIIDHLRRTEKVPVVFFFFRYVVLGNRSARSLVQDWISQLLPYSIALQGQIKGLLDDGWDDEANVNGQVQDSRLWGIFFAAVVNLDKVYCVVDALDEMDMQGSAHLLQTLNKLSKLNPRTIKLLMTSRPKQYLQSELKDTSVIHIDLQQDLVGHDILKYVSHQLKRTHIRPELQISLASIICTRAGGLFLYARLLLDQILPRCQFHDVRDIETLAHTLPLGLTAMYAQLLNEQAQRSGIITAIQVTILQCVTHAAYPLRLNELSDFLRHVYPDLVGNYKDIVRSACSPLLLILEDETVQVIHHSFTEFLLGLDESNALQASSSRAFPVLKSSLAHRDLALIGLKYLRAGSFMPLAQDESVKSDSSQSDDKSDGSGKSCTCRNNAICTCRANCRTMTLPLDLEAAQVQHPFVSYAMHHWSYHAGKYDVVDPTMFQALVEFAVPESPSFQAWASLVYASGVPFKVPPEISTLHMAIFAGMTGYARHLIGAGGNVDVHDPLERTPLWWAASLGNLKIAQSLLKAGADPDADDYQGYKPLHQAVRNRHAAMVKLLLDTGVEISTKKSRENHTSRLRGGERGTTGQTALLYAADHGDVNTVAALLPFCDDTALAELLCRCCHGGKPEAVSKILSASVSPDSMFEGGSALSFAIMAQNPEIVGILLSMGADPDLESDWRPSIWGKMTPSAHQSSEKPICEVAARWSMKTDTTSLAIFEILKEAGADINGVGENNDSCLFKWMEVRRGSGDDISERGLSCLLNAGANVNIVSTRRNYQGETVLLAFLRRFRNCWVVERLLEYGADLRAQTSDGSNVFHLALNDGWNIQGDDTLEDVTQVLLDHGAGDLLGVPNHAGHTPLETAISTYGFSLELFKRLISTFSTQSILDKCLWSLSAQEEVHLVAYFRFLVDSGASLKSRDESGRTFLLSKCHQGVNLVRTLLKFGAHPGEVDWDGRGVLHLYFARKQHSVPVDEHLKALVDLGFDPLAVDHHGETLLHTIAKVYSGTTQYLRLVEQLVQYGVAVNATDKKGSTALHTFYRLSEQQPIIRDPGFTHFLAALSGNEPDMDLNVLDVDGISALHLAAGRSAIEVSRLVEAGANPLTQSIAGKTPLHIACAGRDGNIVSLLVQRSGNAVLEIRDDQGQAPIHVTCATGALESLFYLLQWRSSVSLQDFKGNTPLHICVGSYCALSGSESDSQSPNSESRARCRSKTQTMIMVRMLINAGADAFATNMDGLTPLDIAEESDRNSDLAIVLRHGDKVWNDSIPIETILARSSVFEIFDKLQRCDDILTEKELEVVRDDEGVEPLDDFELSIMHRAALAGATEPLRRMGNLVSIFDDHEILRDYLETVKDDNKLYDLHRYRPILLTACERQQPNLQVLETLVTRCQANVNSHQIVKGSGRGYAAGPTALHELSKAIFWWQLDAIRLLVQHGADINARDEKGQSPLHIAARGGSRRYTASDWTSVWQTDAVTLLLDLGGDPNALDSDFLSPLNEAVGDLAILEILLQRGSRVAHEGKSPLFSALERSHPAALELLIHHGGDVNGVAGPQESNITPSAGTLTRSLLLCASFDISEIPDGYNIGWQYRKSVETVAILIRNGAIMTMPLNNRETLIHYVVEHAHIKIVHEYLDHCNLSHMEEQDQAGRTLLLAACDRRQPSDYIETLSGEHCTLAFPALRLLSMEVDASAVDKKGRNLLHHIFENRKVDEEVAVHVLEHPKCLTMINQKDTEGFTPFHRALASLRSSCCMRILALNADVRLQAPDPEGNTVLHHIASQVINNTSTQERNEAQREFLDLVSKIGLDANITNARGETPLFLFLASQSHTAPYVSIRTDLSGHQSSVSCHESAYATLVRATGSQLDFHARNANGETALHVVAYRNKYTRFEDRRQEAELHDRKLFEFVMSKGVDPLAEDNEGRTALDIAHARNKNEILKLFKFNA